jgi:hypothetical protein
MSYPFPQQLFAHGFDLPDQPTGQPTGFPQHLFDNNDIDWNTFLNLPEDDQNPSIPDPSALPGQPSQPQFYTGASPAPDQPNSSFEALSGGNQSSLSLASNTTSFLSNEALVELAPIADILDRVSSHLRGRLIAAMPEAGNYPQEANQQPPHPPSPTLRSPDPPLTKYRFLIQFPIFARLFHHMESLTISMAYEDSVQFNWDETNLIASVNNPDSLWPFAHEAYEVVIAANNSSSVAPEIGA